MKELGGATSTFSAGDTSTGGLEDAERERALMQAWESMLAEDMDGAMGGTSSGGRTGKAAGTEGAKKDQEEVEDAFQKTIREAMERMKESDDALKVRSIRGGHDFPPVHNLSFSSRPNGGIHCPHAI